MDFLPYSLKKVMNQRGDTRLRRAKQFFLYFFCSEKIYISIIITLELVIDLLITIAVIIQILLTS